MKLLQTTIRNYFRRRYEITSDDDTKLTQDRQCTYNVIMGSGGATTVAVEKQ